MDQITKQEQQQDENYKSKKQELLNNANQRERDMHERAHKKLIQDEDDIARENNRSELERVDDMTKTTQEFAIYDNGDIRTKNNQLVMKIERNDQLDEHEKEKMLQQHEGRMHKIDGALEAERKK